MALKFISFESGSKGNCSLVMSDNTAILIDAGLSPRALKCELGKLGLTMSDLSGVLITHEHSDHIAWVDKYSEVMDVYSTDKTIKSITDKSKKILNVGEVFNFMFGFDIGDLHINPFSISHDAVDPVGYSITQDDKKISIATDSGWVTKEMFDNIKDSNILLLEANHDIDMLKKGTYPYWLKQRILGLKGHICNDVTSSVSCNIKSINGNLQQLILGHISQENNTPDLAYNTVYKKLCEKGLLGDTCVSVASQDCATQLFEVL